MAYLSVGFLDFWARGVTISEPEDNSVTKTNAMAEELKERGGEGYFAKRGTTVVLITPGVRACFQETPTNHTIAELHAAIESGALQTRELKAYSVGCAGMGPLLVYGL
jgi:hypothetical protein